MNIAFAVLCLVLFSKPSEPGMDVRGWDGRNPPGYGGRTRAQYINE